MEGPVLTSASSRLRSAVSACAQPTHSFFGSSSYLGTAGTAAAAAAAAVAAAGIQLTPHDSGGCIKKFNCCTSRNNDGTSFFGKLNGTRKSNQSQSAGENSPNSLRHRQRHFSGSRLHQALGKFYDGRKEFQVSSGNESVACPTSRFAAIRNEPESRLTNRIDISKIDKSEGGANDRVSGKKETVGEIDRGISESLNGNGLEIDSDEVDGKNNRGNRFRSIVDGIDIIESIDNPDVGNSLRCEGRKIDCRSGKSDSVDEEAEEKFEGEFEGLREKGQKDSVEETGNEKRVSSKWQPKHVVTRKTAQILREIRNVWENRVGSSTLIPAENVKLLLDDLQLFPSASQVSEMLKCAQECSKNPSSKHLTFGEFYKFANDLIRTDCRITSSTSPSARVFEKNVEKRGKFSKGMSKYEVFLGGSCNPTTWRTDLAIPELENMNITFYNPQVEEWRPELLEVEYQAKENATVMFFVVDNQTRGVSASIEVAHLAGNRRKLILVIQSFTPTNQIICNERISQEEYDDLKTGQEVLRSLVVRQRIPVFEDIKMALKSTEKILRENLTAQDLLPEELAQENSSPPSPQEIFEKLDSEKSGEIFLRETCLALKLLHHQNVSLKQLESLVKKLENNLGGIESSNSKINLELFLELVNEFERQQQEEIGIQLESSFLTISTCESNCCDVYLGGTLECTQWRQSIAIPMLTAENLSYFVPKVSGGKIQFTEVEAVAMDSSFALLFVITNTARSMAAMAIAGHYIGRGANVVLCVQHLPERVQLGEEILTDRAVKDYNRGRMYLTDIANRSGVSVFEDVSKAVEFVIEKCKNRSVKTV